MLSRLLQNLTKFAKVKEASKDDQQFPQQKVDYDGKLANVFVLFPYGMHGNMSADTITTLHSIQADLANRVAIGGYNEGRPTMADGEVCLYHPPTDAIIHFKENGDLDITSGEGGSGDINIICATANVTGDVKVDGKTDLGTGGAGIARLGDDVEVVITSGSSSGTWAGTIKSASTNNNAN
tara:strand:+ start:16253 stop:16795 length:543 start_codon:yes stop_codon:yes gene_type:complete